MPEKVLFIDRDGTLIQEPDDNQVDALDKVHLVDNVVVSLLELANHGYRFVMISNQDGLGTAKLHLPNNEALAGLRIYMGAVCLSNTHKDGINNSTAS